MVNVVAPGDGGDGLARLAALLGLLLLVRAELVGAAKLLCPQPWPEVLTLTPITPPSASKAYLRQLVTSSLRMHLTSGDHGLSAGLFGAGKHDAVLVLRDGTARQVEVVAGHLPVLHRP